MNDIRDIAEDIAIRTGSDETAALITARFALIEIEPPDGTLWNESALPDHVAAEVYERTLREVSSPSPSPLDRVVDACEALREAESEATAARTHRDQLIREARRAGVPEKTIVDATGLSRAMVARIAKKA